MPQEGNGMRVYVRQAFIFATIFSFLAAAAHAESSFKDGKWRLQISGQTGVDSGGVERKGDFFTLATVEYEFPATQRLTIGLKLHPIFAYTQDEQSIDDFFDGDLGADWEDIDFDLDGDDEGGETVWGGGIGLGMRVYQVKEEHRGLFLDLGVNALVHNGELNGNNSSLNFLSGVGVGYQFKSGLNTQINFAHISNAGLGSENAGANVIGLGLGFRF